MKKYFWLILLSLFLALPLYATVDTKDGTAITDDSNIDGQSENVDTADGMVIKAAAGCAGGADGDLGHAYYEDNGGGLSDNDLAVATAHSEAAITSFEDGTFTYFHAMVRNLGNGSICAMGLWDSSGNHLTDGLTTVTIDANPDHISVAVDNTSYCLNGAVGYYLGVICDDIDNNGWGMRIGDYIGSTGAVASEAQTVTAATHGQTVAADISDISFSPPTDFSQDHEDRPNCVRADNSSTYTWAMP